MKNSLSQRGFSLMELLIVLALILLLSVITFSAFSSKLSKTYVEKEAEVTLSYINKAHNQSVALQDNSSFGVKVASSTLYFFRGTSYASGNDIVTYRFRDAVASTTLTGGVSELYFSRITGVPSAVGTITFTSRKDASTTKTILIQATGLAEIQ